MRVLARVFGKRRTLEHPVLGTLKSQKILRPNPEKEITWYGDVTIGNKPESTMIILEGDFSSPYDQHLDWMTDLIQNWNDKYVALIHEVMVSQNLINHELYTEYPSGFYIGMISPLDNAEPNFELTLETLDFKKSGFLSIEFEGATIVKLESLA